MGKTRCCRRWSLEQSIGKGHVQWQLRRIQQGLQIVMEPLTRFSPGRRRSVSKASSSRMFPLCSAVAVSRQTNDENWRSPIGIGFSMSRCHDIYIVGCPSIPSFSSSPPRHSLACQPHSNRSLCKSKLPHSAPTPHHTCSPLHQSHYTEQGRCWDRRDRAAETQWIGPWGKQRTRKKLNKRLRAGHEWMDPIEMGREAPSPPIALETRAITDRHDMKCANCLSQGAL